MKKFKISYIILGLFCCLMVSSCQHSKEISNQTSDKRNKITIAYQYGIAYAPVEIMQHQKVLENKLPNTEIEWIVQGSGAAINEGIISGDIDVAMMGVAPFLIGWDKGIPYKMYSAISSVSLELVTYDESIQSLEDFQLNDKIAVPSVGSIQHIFLAMAAEKQLGDMHALDKYLINMSHPDALQALISEKEVKAHFASPPYLNMELENENYHVITTASEAMGGDYTFIVGAISDKFYEENPEICQALYEATEESIRYLNDHVEESAKILAEMEHTDADKMLEYLKKETGNYRSEPFAVLDMAEFMERADYISKVPTSLEEIMFAK